MRLADYTWGKPFKTQAITLPDKAAAVRWSQEFHLGRRSFTLDQSKVLRGRLYNGVKKEHGGAREASGQNVHLKTAEKLAATYGVDEKTIRRDAKLVEQLGEDGCARVMADENNCSQTHPILPATESQARPLTHLDADLQQEAWARVVETAPDLR